MLEARSPQPKRLEDRPKLGAALKAIDALNKHDPQTVEYDGDRVPYRLLYSHWLTEWAHKLDPTGPDELFLLARGKSVEGWRLSEIKRDDYAPNSVGTRQWQLDRTAWQANRLAQIARDAGYDDAAVKIVEDVMLAKGLPDPRDVRLYDIKGSLGAINFRLLELVRLIQVLRDAEALVFLEHSFPRMLAQAGAEETLPQLKRELAGASARCLAMVLAMPWSAVQKKLINRALPAPKVHGTLRELEGVAAASRHPGDWRYKDFDYE